jgi:hypothetical protein
MTPAAERKRKSRAKLRALEEAGLIELTITVPIEIGDYLRRRRLLDHCAEDDAASLNPATERLLKLLIADEGESQ